MARRTQRERREATIGKLLDATIECLIHHGYRGASIGRITKQAGVSHGGLFRHFPSRTALLAAATEEIARRHMAALEPLVHLPPGEQDPVESLVRFFREAAQAPLTAAWREVIVAARTDEPLRLAITPAIRHVEESVMAIAGQIPGAPPDSRAFGTLLLSLLHMFDSEASSRVAFVTDDIEALRLDWAVGILRAALRG